MIQLLLSLLLITSTDATTYSHTNFEYVELREQIVILKYPKTNCEYRRALYELKEITLRIQEHGFLFHYFDRHAAKLERLEMPIEIKMRGIVEQLNWHIRKM